VGTVNGHMPQGDEETIRRLAEEVIPALRRP
jgi:hypothetical protein